MTEPVHAPGAEPVADAGRLAARAQALLSERLKRRAAGEGSGVERIPRIPRPDGRAPLSFAQERLWFLDRLQPGSPIYNLSFVTRLRGPLQLPLLAACFDEIARRHEVLRTNVALDNGRPVQVIAPPAARPLRLVDLGGVGAGRRETEARRLLAEAAQRPFDLAADPLLRTDVVRLAGDDHVLLLTQHHIVSDDWSIGVLLAELEALYRADADARRSPLPELPIQYADYAQWQRNWLAGQVLEEQLAFWRRHLEGAPSALELPSDRPRPARQSFRGATRRFTLPDELSAAVRGLARREGATVFMTLLAAFGALLHRLTGQDDFVVGTPIANRGRIELEGLIGLFVNTLALRMDLGAPASSSAISFLELMGRVRMTALDAYAHQDLPFEKLVEELQPERDLSRSPIFQVLFQVLGAGGSLALPGVVAEPVAGAEGQLVKFDLVLSMSDGTAGLSGIWRYRRDLFDDSTIERLNEQFRTLLAGAAAHPERRLSELPLLTACERQQLREWNATGRRHPDADLCLHQLIAQQVERSPQAVAVGFEGQELTYRELAARARGLALRLRALGVGPEVRVGICLERSLELVVGLLGILEAGGAYVPLDPSYPRERLAYLLEDARVAVLLTQERLLAQLGELSAPHVLCLDRPAESRPSYPEASPLPPPDPSSLAYVIYTSGSTGKPKGAMSSHRGIVNRLLWMQERYALTAADRVLQKTPFSFDVSVWELFWPLLVGARLVVARPGGHQDPAYLVETIVSAEITTLHFVPSMLQVFLDAPGVERCTSLRRVIASGEALPPPLEQRFFARLGPTRAGLHNLYGPTEAAVDVTHWDCTPGPGRWVVPIGHPVANTQIHLLGRHGEPVPVGVAGELFIAGVQVGRGYLERPELTAERFVPDPFSSEPGARMYRTGDLARRRVDGAVEYLGRLDHQVKIHGFRIELGEIEAALASHRDVAEAVVVARGRDAGDESLEAEAERRLVAYIVPRHDAADAPPTDGRSLPDTSLVPRLRTWLAATLPEHMVPSTFVVVDTLPLSPNGKVDRRALPEPEVERSAGELTAPRTALEGLLAELFQEALRVDAIGVHDSFFAAGGNSIQGAGLINRLQERLGEIVHVVAIFDAPTVAQLAALLEEKYPSAAARWTGEAPRTEARAKAATRVDAGQLARVRELVERGPRNVAAVPRPARKNRPAVFVLSPPRSGSTLLRVMLGGHPRLFAPPELELLSFATLAERRAAFAGRDAFWLEGLIRAVMAARGLDPEAAGRLVEEHERAGWTTQRFYGRMQEWLGERILVDKTPSYSFHPSILARAEEQFDGALYVHLTRHPCGTIGSFEEARIDQIFFPRHPFALRELAELTWLTSHLNILAFLETVPPERQLRVHFEELLRDPREVTEALAAFVGVPFDPAMLRPYAERSARMTDGLHSGSRMLGDVKFHQHRGIEAAVAQRWRESVDEEALADVTRDVGAVLGYERSGGGATVVIERTGWLPGAPLPLSFQQERLWVLDQLQPGLPTYNIPVALRLRGALDVAALRAAVLEIVRRHAVLRATFLERDGSPYQVVASPCPASAASLGSVPCLAVVDLSRLQTSPREDEARRLVSAGARRPFDLARGPLLRAELLRLDETEHIFALTIHHIVCDGWSVTILLRELLTVYRAFSGGRPSPLPELPIQYPDYAAWQRRWLTGGVLEGQVAHWRERLAGAPTALELPTDRPRPAVQGYRGAHVASQLPPELVETLAALAASEGATLFMVLLAGLDVLLYRHSGQHDLLVGSPIANRTRLATEGLIGFFVNTVVFRANLSGDPPVRELLGRVRDTALAAYAHQDLPFEKLVEALQPVRDLGLSPLFQAMFQFQNLSRELPRVGELRLSAFGAHSGTAKFDLTLTATETAGGLRLFLEYDRDLFDVTTMERLLGHCRTVLAAVATDASRPLSQLPWLTAPERHQLVAEWNEKARDEVGATSVPELIAAQARRQPEVVAVACGDERLSYAELQRRAAALAGRLQQLGAGPEALVGIALERTPSMVAAVLGVLRSGAAYVPLDPEHPRERLGLILETARPLALVTQQDLLGALPAHAAEVVLVDGEEGVFAGELDEPAGAAGETVVSPEQSAYVLFTSGSTGRPKGVQVPHGALLNFLLSMQQDPGFAAGEALLAVTTLSFDIAGLELLLPLIAGGRVELATRHDASDGERLQRRLAESGATVLQATPATWRLLLEADWPGDRRLVALCGGEALPGDLAAQLIGRVGALWNMYGPTETTIWSAARRVRAEEVGEATVPVGGAIANTRLYVVDGGVEPVAVGVAGELAIGGAGLARGYLGAPELTAERFVPDPDAGEPGARMYRTGDLVRWRSDGRIDFLGRMDFQVKVRGFRIELGEIEAALSRHPAVAQAVVMARGGGAAEAREDETRERLVAYVVPRREPARAGGLADELRGWLTGKLPDYMVPSAFVVLEKLPLNPSGKVDRKALPEPARVEVAAGYVAPRGLIEERVAEIWSELLRVERVGAHDSFFTLGGHSLLAARLVSRLRGAFAVEVPLRRIFEAPTLAALATELAALRKKRAPAAPSIQRVPRDRPLPASFAQERLWFLDRLEPGSAAYTIAAAWSLRGPLMVPALGAAFAEVVRRHESLRTVFAPATDAGAVQRVLPFAPSPLPLVDLQGLPPEARTVAARALAVRHARRPFDLAQGPLFRVALLRLQAEEHLLLFAVHHIVSDGWSQGILVTELLELYAAVTAGRPSPLPPLPIQYADYAAWQRVRLQGQVLEAQLAFWREALAGAPAVLELPTDRPRPAVQTFRGGRRLLVLPPPLLSRLRALSRDRGATLFMILLATLQALLARWSGAEDLTVGTPIAGRDRPETEGLIGLFVNTLVLRGELSGDPPFAELLARVRERALAAYAHQDLPFEKLVEALNPERALSHTPLFQVLFVLQNAPRQAAPLPGLRFGRLDVEDGVAKFDLTLAASETSAGLALSLEFNRDLFDSTTAGRFVRHLGALFAGLVDDPRRRLSDLPWLAPEERHQLLFAWNDTARDYGPPATLHALIARQVERTPDAVAVVFESERLTYAELSRRANRLARRLVAVGVGPDRLVAVAAERSCDLVVALLGILQAGGAFVPIDPSYPVERLAYMLEDSQGGAGPPVLLTQQHLLERLPLAPLRARGAEVLLLEAARNEVEIEPDDDPEAWIDGDHAAYMIYTSGSTGRPKGVVNTHRAIVNRLLWMQEVFALDPGDCVLQKTPFSFDVSVWEFFWPLLVGARLVVARPGGHQDARYLARLIQEEGVTTLHFVPSMLQVFLEEPEAAGCRGLRRVVCSGEALAPELVRRFFERLPDGPELHNLYGPTEAAVDVSWWSCTRDDARSGVPIGRPIANLSLHVVDRDLQPVAAGVAGELAIGGVGLARGYHARPEQTAERFVPSRFGERGSRLYRTGDLARLRPDGAIEYLGRLDHQIKLRGLRIELGEVEAALRAHSAVRDAVVVARGEGEAKRLVAYVVGAGGDPSVAALRDHLRARLPEHMVPADWVALPALPLSPNG
ncbi:MAG TPA: amino acid adenylation domain-containing protein, partial [Thermoanaerobaculia bacterium]|nr:amino acid adenylation domain-containing protein [Thermoanaerobaculia bacterium]